MSRYRFATLTAIVLLTLTIALLGQVSAAQALTISDVSSVLTTPNSTYVQWNTDVPANGQVEYGLTTSYGSSTMPFPGMALTRSILIFGLTQNKTYHYRVHSVDAGGNEAVSGDYTFQTTTLTITSATCSNVTSGTALFTWTTNANATSLVEYGPTASYGSSFQPDGTRSTSHSLLLTGLTKDKLYHFRVRSVDAGGNEAVTLDSFFRTLPLTVSGVTASSITSTQATITWSTNCVASSQVDYGPSADNYTQTTPVVGTLTTDHSVVLTGLTPDATYHYRVRSADQGVNEALSGDYSFQTPPQEWMITLRATAGSLANSGAAYLGASAGALDGRDARDAFLPSMPDPNIQIYEMRNNWAGGTKVKSDIRAYYTDATKVWSNWFVWTNAEAGTLVTVEWDPSSTGLPAGQYSIILNFASGVTDPGGNPLDVGPVIQEISPLGGGGMQFVTAETGVVQASITVVCKVGNGPDLFKRVGVTTDGNSTSKIACAPIVDAVGRAFFGSDQVRRIFSVDALADPAVAPTQLSTLTAAQGNIRGRLANYAGYAYGVTDTGYVVKRNMEGLTGGNWATAAMANAYSVPAVTSDGTLYVGSNNTVKRLSAAGAVIAISPELAGPVGSASIPGSDLVWVNAGNEIVCLNSTLSTVRANIDLGAQAGPPATRFGQGGRTVVTAGNRVVTLNATSMQILTDRTVDGTIDGSPYFNSDGSVIFATSAHKLYAGPALTSDPFTAVALPGAAGPIKGSVIVGANWTAIAGGGDQNVYLVNNTTGQATFLGVNQDTLGCSTDLNGHIYFTSTDGNLYVIE